MLFLVIEKVKCYNNECKNCAVSVFMERQQEVKFNEKQNN